MLDGKLVLCAKLELTFSGALLFLRFFDEPTPESADECFVTFCSTGVPSELLVSSSELLNSGGGDFAVGIISAISLVSLLPWSGFLLVFGSSFENTSWTFLRDVEFRFFKL